jgi:hypothetical protein
MMIPLAMDLLVARTVLGLSFDYRPPHNISIPRHGQPGPYK